MATMDGNSQHQITRKPMEFIDLHDGAIEQIFQRLNDKDLVNVAYTCRRLHRIIHNFLPQKYPKSLRITSSDAHEKLSLMLSDANRCPSLEDVVRLYPDVQALHLNTYDSFEELYPIAKHLKRLTDLDLKIYVRGYNHIFQSADRIQRMLCIACDKQLPIQRLKMDMEFGFIVNMLWMIAENLPQLKEVELIFQYEMCVGEIEDENCLRFKKLEKLSVHCAQHIGEELAAIRSIAMFKFDVLNEFTLKGLRGLPTDAIQFIIRQSKLQKLKLIDCDGVNAKILCKFKKKLPKLKEIVTDVDEESVKVLKQRFGSRWVVSEQSEMYDKKLKMTWTFTLSLVSVARKRVFSRFTC